VKRAHASGGGVFAHGALTVSHSVITNNQAIGDIVAGSGGLRTQGDLTLQYSTVSDNVAYCTCHYSVAGGLSSWGNALVQNATISGNRATSFAAFAFNQHNNAPMAMMINSTVSGNQAIDGGMIGGGYTSIPLTIYNSTIAFNTGGGASGIYVYGAPLILQSTIIADNSPVDLVSAGGATLGGANNLIVNGITVPPGTLTACPQLEALADNGGPTLTHMLRSTSPAIGMGNNPTGVGSDQRGDGFPRMFGAAVDIGAVEWQGLPDDRVFKNSFERGCNE